MRHFLIFGVISLKKTLKTICWLSWFITVSVYPLIELQLERKSKNSHEIVVWTNFIAPCTDCTWRQRIYFAELSIKRLLQRTLSLILLVSVVVADITLTFLSRNFSFSDLICSNSSEWDSRGGQSCLLSWLMKLFGFCPIQFILRRILTQSHYQRTTLCALAFSRFHKIFFV